MSNLSDKEIDRLSREAADFYEPDDSSLSWTRLEQKLIEQIPERPPDSFRFGRINPYVWGSAVMLLAGVSFFVIKSIYYSKHSTPTVHHLIQIAPSSDANSKKISYNTIHFDSSSSVQDADGNVNKKPDLAKKPNVVADASVISSVSGRSNSNISTSSEAAKIRRGNSNTAINESNSVGKRSASKSGYFSAPAAAGFDASRESNIGNGKIQEVP